MKFFVLSHSQKKGNVGVAYIINWPHPFFFEHCHTRQFRNIAHPSTKKKIILSIKKTMSILLKTSKRKQNSGG
jgi:hypothetical protein